MEEMKAEVEERRQAEFDRIDRDAEARKKKMKEMLKNEEEMCMSELKENVASLKVEEKKFEESVESLTTQKDVLEKEKGIVAS